MHGNRLKLTPLASVSASACPAVGRRSGITGCQAPAFGSGRFDGHGRGPANGAMVCADPAVGHAAAAVRAGGRRRASAPDAHDAAAAARDGGPYADRPLLLMAVYSRTRVRTIDPARLYQHASTLRAQYIIITMFCKQGQTCTAKKTTHPHHNKAFAARFAVEQG